MAEALGVVAVCFSGAKEVTRAMEALRAMEVLRAMEALRAMKVLGATGANEVRLTLAQHASKKVNPTGGGAAIHVAGGTQVAVITEATEVSQLGLVAA